MLWLVLLCVVTFGTSTHPSDDVTWLPLPQQPSAHDSAENGTTYTERLVHHWHHRLRNTSHRPSHRPLSPENKYNAWHSRTRHPTHHPPRTSKPSEDKNNNNHNKPNHRLLEQDPSSHSRPNDDNIHRPPRAPSKPVDRYSSHYVNDVDLLSTFNEKRADKLQKYDGGEESVYKAWPGDYKAESLDDLILYHTYTSDTNLNNFKLDGSTKTTTPKPPKPAQDYLDALLVHHNALNPSTTPPSSSSLQYDLIAQTPHKFQGKVEPLNNAPHDTKVSLDKLILLHTKTTDDNPRPIRPVSNHHPGPQHTDHGSAGIIHKPTKWDQHYHKPQRPYVILFEDVMPPHDHYPPRPGHRPPPPQTVQTVLSHRPDPPTTQSAASLEASQIVVIHNNYPSYVSTSTMRPYYTSQRPHYTTSRRPLYTVHLYPAAYPEDLTTKRPSVTVETTQRPPYMTVKTPQSHYTTDRPNHVPSTAPHPHYSSHPPPHYTITTAQSHYNTHGSTTPQPPYSSNTPPYFTATTSQSPYNTHRPTTPHPPYSTHTPPHITVTTPQSHYKPTFVPSSTPRPPYSSHRPPYGPSTTSQYDHTINRPTYITATTPQPSYSTHRPPYVTVINPQSHYTTHGPSYVTVHTPQNHFTSHHPTYVSTTTSPPYYPPHKPTYMSTSPKPHHTSHRPPYQSSFKPQQHYPSHSEKPPHVVVVCPNITITSTINNYNTYTNASKEGCADVNIVINNENLLIKDPTLQTPTSIQGEVFPPQGDDPGDSSGGDSSEEEQVETFPVVNQPWRPWDLFGIKGPLLDVLELLTLFWSSLPNNIMTLLIVVATLKKFAIGLALGVAWWKHKQKEGKKKKKRMDGDGGGGVYNTHLHLKDLMGSKGSSSHHHKVRRKYNQKEKDGGDEEVRGDYERERDEALSGGGYENHRVEYGEVIGDSYENHRDVYGDSPLRDGYNNHREEYLDPRTAGRDGYSREEDEEDVLGGYGSIRESGEDVSEDGGEVYDSGEYDVLAGGRRMGRGTNEATEFLDEMEDYVRGLIEAFKIMPDEGKGSWKDEEGKFEDGESVRDRNVEGKVKERNKRQSLSKP